MSDNFITLISIPIWDSGNEDIYNKNLYFSGDHSPTKEEVLTILMKEIDQTKALLGDVCPECKECFNVLFEATGWKHVNPNGVVRTNLLVSTHPNPNIKERTVIVFSIVTVNDLSKL